jgi:hypothetical protein
MPHNFNNFGQGQGGMGGGNQFTGGMFGPVGGTQNIGGRGMSDQELQALLMQMGGGGGGGSLPVYNDPLAGPTGPTGPQEINTSALGINPAGMAPGGAAGMDFGTGAIDQGVSAMGDAGMQMAMQMAEAERQRKMMLQMQMATGGGGFGPAAGQGFSQTGGGIPGSFA